MIRYKISKQNNSYKIDVNGHANQNPYGSDIVCASVSTMLIMTYNLLERLNLFSCNITKPICEEGKFSINIDLSNDTAIKILDNLKDSLDMLATTYPKNIKIDN